MVDWSQILGDLITQGLRIIIPVFIALIAKWAIELYLKIKAEQPNIIPLLDYLVEQAVLAAEMIYGSGKGAEKKAYAIGMIEAWMKESGMPPIDMDIIADAIEAEVYRQFHMQTIELIQEEEPEKPAE